MVVVVTMVAVVHGCGRAHLVVAALMVVLIVVVLIVLIVLVAHVSHPLLLFSFFSPELHC